MTQDKFIGWVAHDESAVDGKMVWEEFTPKEFKETDVEIKVEATGICASDLHTLRSGWGPTIFPAVVGHEIVGKVTKIGKEVKNVTVGMRVGVGAQSNACLQCEQCNEGLECYCDGIGGTYNSKYPDGSGFAMGGYAKQWRGPSHFVIPIPDGLESHIAAPLLCGGVTIFSPLSDLGCGQIGGKRVGIVGIGGIGAFGLAFAKALGATTIVAISTTGSKKDLAMQLGATDFIAMKDNPEDYKRLRRRLDIIINTASNADSPFDKYLTMLRPRGHLMNIAIPEAPVMPIPIFGLVVSGASLGGSSIGSINQIKAMLEVAASKKPNFMIEKRKMSDANQAILDMEAGKPRFRYTLINDD